MSYQVLARKWRPKTFKEMIGQAHVKQALINGLDNNRLHHALLFTGTRGVGKTTIARIYAKALNCLEGMSSEPCGVCSVCTAIDQGNFLDLIEVDAASRTKVDDTRELLDNVQYTPTIGRCKVYLIDEVHMLSGHSFNALLKTLEEPPEYVKFLLATTDPQKLPVTILSRCLQFNLKRLEVSEIEAHLCQLLDAEEAQYDVEALSLLARAADGSVRDGLSLLDQALAFGAGKVLTDDVMSMLGSISSDHIVAILTSLTKGDASALFHAVEQLSAFAPDFQKVLQDLTESLHRIALTQTFKGALDQRRGDAAKIEELATKISPEQVQLFYQIGITGRRDLPLAPTPRTGLEMTLLRMLSFCQLESGSIEVSSASPAKALEPSTVAKINAPSKQEYAAESWQQFVDGGQLAGPAKLLASNVKAGTLNGGCLALEMSTEKAHIRSKLAESELLSCCRLHYAGIERLNIEMREQPAVGTPAETVAAETEARNQAAREVVDGNPLAEDLMKTFGAVEVPGSLTTK